MEDNFSVESYNFDLPKELIAQEPPKEREFSKLLVYNRSDNTIKHLQFYQIVDLIDENTCIVLNNTMVDKRKIICKKTTGSLIPILITEYENNEIKFLPYKRVKIGTKIILPNNTECEIKSFNQQTGEYLMTGNFKKNEIDSLIQQYGLAPLPPYIKRKKDEKKEVDLERYQTVYATQPGSIAAPTAGFHFSEKIISELAQKKVRILYITLNIGLATFKPVKTQDIRQHKLLPEKVIVEPQVAQEINQAVEEGKKILCVGTTTVRTLEFLATQYGKIVPYCGEVDLYIYPGYEFKITSCMITNFHLPKSSNLILVSAFVGRQKLLELYKIAIEHRYRFYSYGDAMLIL